MRHLIFLFALILFACHSEGTTDVQIVTRSDEAQKTMAVRSDAPCDYDQPSVTWRLVNPVENGDTITYDAEFIADQPSIRLDGMNIRLFTSNVQMTILDITDYAPGYGYPGNVNEVVQVTHPAAGPYYFGFPGAVVRIGKYMELIDDSQPPIYLDDWVKLYSIRFLKYGEVEHPIVILDKQRIEAKGSFLRGSEGVTIVVRVPGQDLPINVCEFVQHVNWVQTQDKPTFGHPIN